MRSTARQEEHDVEVVVAVLLWVELTAGVVAGARPTAPSSF
jgi:hypothetical protein